MKPKEKLINKETNQEKLIKKIKANKSLVVFLVIVVCASIAGWLNLGTAAV